MSEGSGSVNPEQPFGAYVENVPLDAHAPTTVDVARATASGSRIASFGSTGDAFRGAKGASSTDASNSKPPPAGSVVHRDTGGRHHGGAKSSPVASGRDARPELFQARVEGKRTYTRYVPAGRLNRLAKPLTSDLCVGKIGVLSAEEAELLEEKLMSAFCHDDLSLADKSEAFREDFLRALHLFLAINSGSLGNASGRTGVRDDSQPLRFGDTELSAVDVATIIGDRAYSYMRVRATQIRDTIESAFATSLLPGAEIDFPGICYAVDLIKVVAASKGLSQYPQYVAVGSQYAAGTPPFVMAAIQESSSKVLNTTQGNVRRTDGQGSSSSANNYDYHGGR